MVSKEKERLAKNEAVIIPIAEIPSILIEFSIEPIIAYPFMGAFQEIINLIVGRLKADENIKEQDVKAVVKSLNGLIKTFDEGREFSNLKVKAEMNIEKFKESGSKEFIRSLYFNMLEMSKILTSVQHDFYTDSRFYLADKKKIAMILDNSTESKNLMKAINDFCNGLNNLYRRFKKYID